MDWLNVTENQETSRCFFNKPCMKKVLPKNTILIEKNLYLDSHFTIYKMDFHALCKTVFLKKVYFPFVKNGENMLSRKKINCLLISPQLHIGTSSVIYIGTMFCNL